MKPFLDGKLEEMWLDNRLGQTHLDKLLNPFPEDRMLAVEIKNPESGNNQTAIQQRLF